MKKIRVMVVDDIEETRKNIKALLSFEKRIDVVGEAADGKEAIFIAKEAGPDIVLMDINMPVMDGIKATHEITANCPETVVIMMSVQGEQEYLKKAMGAGARQYLVKPFTAEELINVITETYSLESKRKQHAKKEEVPEEIKSKVITVFSTKGGVGKTTIATNLAVSLSRITKKNVALIDLDLQFGDIAIMLNVSIKNTISDIVKDFKQLDSETIEDYLVTHFSGVKVLPAPAKPEYAEFITAEHIEKIIKALKEKFHYIIIDTSASFNEVILTTLDLSDNILVVSTLDVPAIKNIKTGLEVMKSLNYSQNKVKVILNKTSENYGVKLKDFEETLKYPVWAGIPEDSTTVITSANKGFPFVITRTETRVSRAIINICRKFESNIEKKAKEPNSFKKIIGMLV